MKKKKFIIIGSGLAGLKAAVTAAANGCEVDLITRFQGGRSASACAQGGINAALNNYNDGDSPEVHAFDTIRAGAFLADQTKCKNLCEAAPRIVEELAFNGVLFNRMPDGRLDQRYFGGSKKRRTCFVGSSSGQAILTQCESVCRYYEVNGKITRYENFEFLSVCIDRNGHCAGVTAQHVPSGEIKGFSGDIVIMATGGSANIYGKSTNPLYSNGSAIGGLFEQGALIANPEFFQFHPTAMLGNEKNPLISECARGEGGRVFTYKDNQRWYFLEEMFPEWGNLITRDEASKAIYYVCNELNLGAGNKYEVLLDISHLDHSIKKEKLKSIIEQYRLYSDGDPDKIPMRIFPSAHYYMGGLYVDDKSMTSIKGLFAAGECEFSYHGANRLGANSLLSAIYDGETATLNALEYDYESDDSECVREEIARQTDIDKNIKSMSGTENPWNLTKKLGNLMRENVFIVRYNEILEFTETALLNMLDRFDSINVIDKQMCENQSVLAVRQLKNMLHLARATTRAALMRDESRGAHYKPQFPDRNNTDFLKTTIVSYDNGGIDVSYKDVDTSLYEVD